MRDAVTAAWVTRDIDFPRGIRGVVSLGLSLNYGNVRTNGYIYLFYPRASARSPLGSSNYVQLGDAYSMKYGSSCNNLSTMCCRVWYEYSYGHWHCIMLCWRKTHGATRAAAGQHLICRPFDFLHSALSLQDHGSMAQRYNFVLANDYFALYPYYSHRTAQAEDDSYIEEIITSHHRISSQQHRLRFRFSVYFRPPWPGPRHLKTRFSSPRVSFFWRQN